MEEGQLVLHGLAIKKRGSPAAVAQITGLDEAVVQVVLDAAARSGRVVKAGGQYMLQPAAQVVLKTGYSRDFAALRADADVQEAYEAFESVNERLKLLITDWQMVTIAGKQVPNDHSDPAYDDKIINRLGQLHERAESILDCLTASLPRLAVYKALLTAALEKAEDGDTAWISDTKCMSYHTVWFDLHEDLIRILARARVD